MYFPHLQLILARRQRNNRRPNIGRAIAGLARDRNPADGEEVGDNIDELTWARVHMYMCV